MRVRKRRYAVPPCSRVERVEAFYGADKPLWEEAVVNERGRGGGRVGVVDKAEVEEGGEGS